MKTLPKVSFVHHYLPFIRASELINSLTFPDPITEPILPAPDTLSNQFGARATFMIADSDDFRLSPSYWFCQPSFDDGDFDSDQVGCLSATTDGEAARKAFFFSKYTVMQCFVTNSSFVSDSPFRSLRISASRVGLDRHLREALAVSGPEDQDGEGLHAKRQLCGQGGCQQEHDVQHFKVPVVILLFFSISFGASFEMLLLMNEQFVL